MKLSDISRSQKEKKTVGIYAGKNLKKTGGISSTELKKLVAYIGTRIKRKKTGDI